MKQTLNDVANEWYGTSFDKLTTALQTEVTAEVKKRNTETKWVPSALLRKGGRVA